MGHLILVRHGESTYNQQGLWCGWADPDLTEKGRQQAQELGKVLQDIAVDYVYVNHLKRTQETYQELAKSLVHKPSEMTVADQLMERNYGIYTGKNKWEVKKEVGEEEFQQIRRGWDHPIPEGESLKEVYDREIPYLTSEILPKVKANKNVMIVSSGNALRAIVKYLQHISDTDIANIEFGIAEAWDYELNDQGSIINKTIRAQNENRGKE